MDFLKQKFDNLSLGLLVILFTATMIWADVHASDKFLSWLEQTTTTVLGAYIGLTQAPKLMNKIQNGGTTNGTKTNGGGVTPAGSTT